MERSRSKRSFYHDDDYASRTKPRHRHHYPHRRSNGYRPPPAAAGPVAISFRILCPDAKSAAVLGKAGAAVKALRQETGAWIGDHPVVAGDEERLVEVSEGGSSDAYSPAEQTLLLLHERSVDAEDEVGGRRRGWSRGLPVAAEGGGSAGRVASRLVVPRAIVGCILGKGGRLWSR